MMTSLQIRVVAVLVIVIGDLMLVTPHGLAQPRVDAREQVALAQKKRAQAASERSGLTPEQIDKFSKSDLGKPILYDRTRKVAVTRQENAERGVAAVHIVPESAGLEAISVDYRLGTDAAPASFTYASRANSADSQSILWRDLNGDGVFDLLLIRAKHNDLLKLDQGAHILLDGKWVAAVGDESASEPVMKIADVAYGFDATTGRWQER